MKPMRTAIVIGPYLTNNQLGDEAGKASQTDAAGDNSLAIQPSNQMTAGAAGSQAADPAGADQLPPVSRVPCGGGRIAAAAGRRRASHPDASRCLLRERRRHRASVRRLRGILKGKE